MYIFFLVWVTLQTMTFLSIEQMSCWILDKIQPADTTVEPSRLLQPAQLEKVCLSCCGGPWTFFISHCLYLLCKHNLSLSGKVRDRWRPAGSAWPVKSAWRMGDMSGMPLLAPFDTTGSVWVAGHVSRVSRPWNSHHSERMFSIRRPRSPEPLSEKVKFGPSVTDQRAGPSSWWPSATVKMFGSPSAIACPTFYLYLLLSSNVAIEINAIKSKVVPP